MATLRELWAALRNSESSETAGDLRMRICHAAPDLRVFAAVAGERKQAGLVIEIPKQLLPAQLSAIGGRRLSILAGELAGLPSGRGAVVVQLLDENFEDLFEQLGACLLAEISAKTTPAEALHGAVQQIERWRRFLERRREGLSSEEVRGLIGELAILERLAGRIGPHAALSSWKAPAGSIRDYESEGTSIEVKTFIKATGASVRINDPLQLEPSSGATLLLACVELVRTQKANCLLPNHVARVARLFAHDPALLEQFGNALAMTGYLDAHADLYVEKLAVSATHAFQVKNDFPRIRAADIPPHVVNVQFSLEVLPLARFAVSADALIGGSDNTEPTPSEPEVP